MGKKLISIVVPMYFEEEVAEECYKRLSNILKITNFNYEIIFVNDGSTDNTFYILKNLAKKDSNVKIINFSRNFGHQIAVTAGIQNAKGDAIIIIDADLQDPPELILDMIQLWQQGYNVVYAKRKKRKGETLFKLLTAKIYYKSLSSLSDVKIPVDTGDFRLIDRRVADTLKQFSEHNRFLRGIVSWIGFKQIPIEYERDKRFAGKTKYPLKKMLKFALDGIISFSSKPLKTILWLGVIFIIITVLIFICFIFNVLIKNNCIEIKWGIMMITVFFLGSIQLISIGILAHYIAYIYDESKNRPLYIIDKKINFD